MEGNNSSGSLIHKLLASPRFSKRECQQQAGESAVLKSFRTLPEEESYPHPANHGDINNSCVRVGSTSADVLQSSSFLGWRRPFSSSFTDLDSDVVQVTRVETYIDNENEEEKVIEKSSSFEQNWDLHHHERDSNVSKTDATLSVLTDRNVLELTRGDDRSLLNKTWSNDRSDRKEDSSPYSVDHFGHEVSSKGFLRDSYLNSGDGQIVSPYRTLDSPHESPYRIEDSVHDSTYRTEDSLLKLSTEHQPTPAPDENALDSRSQSLKQISHQEESCVTATPNMSFTYESHSSIDTTSLSSTLQPGDDMTKDPLQTNQKESLNDSVLSATSPSQDITEDMHATKKTTSNPSTSPTHKTRSTTSREPFQMPALFSGVRVLKKGAMGEDQETVSEIKQKDTDRALLSLKQHVNKAKLKQHQVSTSTHKKGADPKPGANSRNQWRRMLNFDDNEESLEKGSKGNEDLDTAEKVQAKDASGESFKFLSSFKPLFMDNVVGDTSVDLEAVKKKRKNDRELLKSIFEKSPSKSQSIDKSPGEVCIPQNTVCLSVQMT